MIMLMELFRSLHTVLKFSTAKYSLVVEKTSAESTEWPQDDLFGITDNRVVNWPTMTTRWIWKGFYLKFPVKKRLCPSDYCE